MNDVGIPALSLAVIKNNEVVYFNAFGYKHGTGKDPVDTATLFQAGSLTKSFLVFIVYKLVDQGLLDLNKPMYQYLEYPPLQHDPRYKLITPRMILSHSSGIENWTSDNNPDTLQIVSNPGKSYVYSGEGYVYLAKVVELIIGKPYEQYVQDWVIKPLHLSRSFSHFSKDGTTPQNYALGHSNLGKEFSKMKPAVPDPAGSMEISAQDYARLLIAIFNKKYLSQNRIRDILQPVVQLDPKKPGYYFGPGFELVFTANDTLIAHGGSTLGYKAMMFYSIVTGNGFVFLTNSDRGEVLSQKMAEYTVGFNLEEHFKTGFVLEQYPSDAVDCLKIYRQNGAKSMFAAIESLKRNAHRNSLVKTMNELGFIFLGDDPAVARKLLEDDVKINPGSSLAVYLLAHTYMRLGEYKLAYDNLIRARELHFDLEPMDEYLKECKEKIDGKAAK